MRKVLLGTAAIAAIVIAQSPRLERLVFTETARLAAMAPQSRIGETTSLPAQVSAASYSPGYARRTLVPAMRGPLTIGDIDGNGEPDLYVVDPSRSNLLLRSTGNGRFRDITAAAKLSSPQASLSATFSDYDHSGRQSLFIVGAEGVTLYRNNGNNAFSDVTQKAGLQSIPGELYTSAALGDLDGDGFPDLLVAIYTNLSRPPSKPAFTFPNDFSGADSRLYRNNGNGTFTDVTEAAGLARNPGRARKAIFADFNNDQRLDILLLRDEKPPALYLNQDGWKFVETTWSAGEALTSHAFFDAAVADLNGDAKLDMVLWSTISFRVLLNQGNATFEQAKSMPLIPPPLSPFGFHGMISDLDKNGSEDVITVDRDGHLHALSNDAGTFREVSLVLPPGFESGYIAPLQFRGLRSPQFVAIHSDGHIVFLAVDTRVAVQLP